MKEWKTIDKSGWPRGEWDNEPDKVQWIDEKSGLDCLIVRGPSGALCGYVGVPESNANFDVDYDNAKATNPANDDDWIEVHGGLTFSKRCTPTEDESRHICHSGDVANKTVWWLGFDCAHSGDSCPQYTYGDVDSEYRDISYVRNQVENLAAQVA